MRKKGVCLSWFTVIILIMIVMAGSLQLSGCGSGKKGVTTISEASLKKVIEVSTLSTVEFTYNSITSLVTDDNKVKCHVAYEGVIFAGIDMDKVKITVDEDSKVINIILPEAEIQDCDVNAGTMEYIFENEKNNTIDISHEAYSASIKDLKQKAESEPQLLALAKSNAISAFQGLLSPWIEQMQGDYTVEVK